VVRADTVLAETFAEVMRDALGHAAGVHEDERRRVLAYPLGKSIVDFGPLLVGRNGLQIRAGHLDRDVEVASMADVDDRAVAARADEIPGSPLDGVHRGRKADALGAAICEGVEARER